MHDVESVLRVLRRFPDAEAPNLFASDAADRLILDTAADSLTGTAGDDVVVIGDRYGALTFGAAAHGGKTGIRVHQDPVTGELALKFNASALGSAEAYRSLPLSEELLAGARVVLMQLPRSLAELTEIAENIAAYAAPDVTVFAGGRDKHMTPAMNGVLRASFESVTAGRGRQKSRVLTASGPIRRPPRSYPVTERLEDIGLTVVAHGAVFAGPKLDIGTRFLASFVGEMKPDARDIVDLGCGTGILACLLAESRKSARVVATDRSAAAVASASATASANNVNIAVVRDDAMSTFEDRSVDLIVLNPPFHEGASLHTGSAEKLFAAAGRTLRPGGELWTVYNTHLNYRGELRAAVGPTESVGRNAKFTVTRSTPA
ncbi:class I SAM-dependent methyltransferase [Rhodococcoides kyotonense]|uniref:16S rRNA (Guanine1207-N2)-methyltransferase n=1 Tax=Rhodococcoides kyotonense TaxID=398843 RepID=A0A239MJ50_9NOCA|nr:methyltransferase [Rhodococcus kyotonensis]SNT41839.1 16S rRNA (guanine1207-N2)-methyltransferase [Rhodococcus kyotonensis]